MATEYSLQAWIDANTSLLTLIKAETGTPTIKIFDSGDVELASVTIDEATSAVNGTTGVLTLEIDTQEASTTAGTASYAQVCDGVGDPHIQLPCQAGSSAAAGYCVVNTLTILAGQTFDVLSASIGVGDVIGA
jgi:hypothetical protein